MSTFSVKLDINFLEQHEEWNENMQTEIKLNSFISSGHSCSEPICDLGAFEPCVFDYYNVQWIGFKPFYFQNACSQK